jgi:hypothetical protein
MTEKRRDEIAAPAMVARISTFRRSCILSEVGLDIFVIDSILADKDPDSAMASAFGVALFSSMRFHQRVHH